MKLESIKDIDKLPSVLNVSELSVHLIELVSVIRSAKVPAVEGAEAINDLLSYRGYSTVDISKEASCMVVEWITEIYDGDNKGLTECNVANIANLDRDVAIEFLTSRLVEEIRDFERIEVKEALGELGVKT